MDKVTQSNAASAEESAAASEELNAQAETLKDAVHRLQQLVGGGGESAETPVHAAAPVSHQAVTKAPAPKHRSTMIRSGATPKLSAPPRDQGEKVAASAKEDGDFFKNL